MNIRTHCSNVSVPLQPNPPEADSEWHRLRSGQVGECHQFWPILLFKRHPLVYNDTNLRTISTRSRNYHIPNASLLALPFLMVGSPPVKRTFSTPLAAKSRPMRTISSAVNNCEDGHNGIPSSGIQYWPNMQIVKNLMDPIIQTSQIAFFNQGNAQIFVEASKWIHQRIVDMLCRNSFQIML